jgi:FixJ family two-component response regulator
MPLESTSKSIVYIVDDDPLIRESSKRLFSSFDMIAETFANAQQFLDHHREDLPGCLILDYQMPEKNGLELQQELIARKDDLPIIFLTAHGDIPTSVKAIRSGAVDFLTKPVEQQVLLESVRKAIDWHIQHRALGAEVRDTHRRIKSLTPREYQVMQLAIEGLLNKQIAKQLGIAERTVKEHRHQVMKKMGTSSIARLAQLCERAKADLH